MKLATEQLTEKHCAVANLLMKLMRCHSQKEMVDTNFSLLANGIERCLHSGHEECPHSPKQSQDMHQVKHHLFTATHLVHNKESVKPTQK